MSDNKRYVSYMYVYRNDEKVNNVGYTRVDARGSQCKILVHISLQGNEGKLLKAYMFYRNASKVRFAYLGNILISNGVGEIKVKAERENVMNSDLCLDDMCGVIVYDSAKIFMGCEWDDQPITQKLKDYAENPELKGNITYSEKTLKKEEKIIKKPEQPVVVDYEGKPVEVEKIVIEKTPEAERLRKDTSVSREAVATENEKKEIQSGYEPEHTQKMQEEIVKEENVDPMDVEMTQQESSNEGAPTVEENFVSSNEPKLQIASCQEVECVEPTYGAYGEDIEFEQPMRDPKSPSMKFECNRTARNIFRKFPRIYPFEDNEICDCVRIEPQDIGLFPIDAWILGNNSFLLHGYYTYHHLIFGRINTTEGIVYVIGVPGVYQNRENFMARMFGFEYFKCAKAVEQKNGEFGYYYLPISFD